MTVSYDTEHEMRFRRVTPTVATARSVATRIEQLDGGDHGFLWRLHSYWRYEETGGGVLVELRSLTLSRSVPALVRPIAGPLVTRVARESMVRTLEALRRYFADWRVRSRGSGGANPPALRDLLTDSAPSDSIPRDDLARRR